MFRKLAMATCLCLLYWHLSHMAEVKREIRELSSGRSHWKIITARARK